MCPNIDNGAIVYDKYRRDLLEEVAGYGRKVKFRRVDLYDFLMGMVLIIKLKLKMKLVKIRL